MNRAKPSATVGAAVADAENRFRSPVNCGVNGSLPG